MNFFSYRQFLELTMQLSMVPMVVGFVLFVSWIISSRKTGDGKLLTSISKANMLFTGIAFLLSCAAMTLRYIEVQHWPAQTMYEVIPLGVCAAYLSTLALYYVLGLNVRQGIARAFGDLFVALIMTGGVFTLQYVLRLDPTGKALPPALQSYWFSTHITAYMIGYFTLIIAALAAWLHLCFQFWSQLICREKQTKVIKYGVPLIAITAAPFGSIALMMGFGVFVIAGVVSAFSLRSDNKMQWYQTWERESDNFTWLIFVVGFPFLTSGLIQGALWAQEAWANYWGWDSKEVSALISWFFYLIYLHLRLIAGWRGEKAMMLLCAGALSIFITFQLFGYLPDSQKSLHRYTDMETLPSESMMLPLEE
ncbi:MAG: cytochrome c biogenesis protein CcsA [Planctomycetes bacterium]|nr:cytochrome c biogenesis protein CcsA [Planctomycetota bacterium]